MWTAKLRPAPLVVGIAALLIASFPAAASAAAWQALDYGGSDMMTVYKPASAPPSPAVVVALHTCGGSMAMAQGWFQSLADKYGFLIIAGKSAGGCWDAAVGRTGERATVVQAVTYVLQQYNADKARVFAAGASSGACMTQALLASYPDVFAGGSSLAAVPAGAWTGGGNYGWSAPSSTTAQAWGDKVRQADPGFTGARPRIQLWQGQGDTNLTYAMTYPAEVAQWTNVFGVTDADAIKTSVKPSGATDTWARTSYKDSTGTVVVETNSGPSNVPHDLTPRGLWADVIRFFGLDGSVQVVTHDGGVPGTGGGAGGVGAAGSGAGGVNTGGAAKGGAIGSGNGGAVGGSGMTVTGGSNGAPGSAGTIGAGGTDPGSNNTGGAGPSRGSGGATASDSDHGSSGGGCSVAACGDGPAAAVLLVLAALGIVCSRSRRRSR